MTVKEIVETTVVKMQCRRGGRVLSGPRWWTEKCGFSRKLVGVVQANNFFYNRIHTSTNAIDHPLVVATFF